MILINLMMAMRQSCCTNEGDQICCTNEGDQPFGQRHVAINIYNICKGHFVFRTHAQKKYGKVFSTFIFLKLAKPLLKVLNSTQYKDVI